LTDPKRRIALQTLIEKYTLDHTATKQVAREALIQEGIYTKKGALRVEFGGVPKKPKNTA
jgi:hypothetical protein